MARGALSDRWVGTPPERHNVRVWIDETDTTQLAQRLRVGPNELIRAIGGPWRVSWRIPELEQEQPGTLFIGRAGPSVAILVDDDGPPVVDVGTVRGRWQGPTTLQWMLDERTGTVEVPPATAPSTAVDLLLEELRSAVDAAYERAAPSLVTCRYCGSLVAPAHSMGEERCAACGTAIFGIQY